ncbi:isochorismate synthase, partial [Photobacterium damselae subsp. damselae]|nr:isochorismate synthase [Photobacterium damselae subsp. damselae]
MTALQQAVEHLIAKIQQAKQTTHRVMVQLDLPIQAELIDWMENQPVFPKFYWQSRDGQEEVVALGQVKTFTDPLAAEKVIHDDQRVWGGRSFDGRTDRNRRCLSAFFFLPQLEIMRHGQTWSVAINLGDDYQKVLDGLA